MQLAEISIRRPVFATVLSLLVLLIGAVSFTRLSVREYPKIDEPVVTVRVNYAGASAEVIESQVTKPLEDSIAGIDAVDVITSISRAEQSQISVRFRLEKDADNAAAEVRDRTARVRNRLPDAVDEPVIAKVEADASPVMWLAFSSDTRTPLEINDLVNRIARPRLQTVTGVADVPIYGERKYAMRVWLDPERLAAYRLTTQDVEDAIRRNNLELPAGRIESQQREFSVTSQTDLVNPAQFGEVVIRSVNGFPVKIRDVARVEEGPADERSGMRMNGKPAIGAGVIRQATANPLTLAQGVRDEEVLHLRAAEVEHVRAPVRLVAAARVGVLVQRLAVEACERERVAREVGRHPVEDHADARLVQPVDEVTQPVLVADALSELQRHGVFRQAEQGYQFAHESVRHTFRTYFPTGRV